MADTKNENEGLFRKTTGLPPADGEMPPFFKTWNALYVLVLAQLLLMIAGFYFFTKLFE
jgi:hypothetical protein